MTHTLFSYVQIGAKNSEALADFYIKTLGFSKSSEKQWLPGEGRVLTAPGYDKEHAITFGFVPAFKGSNAQINDAGYAHICFETTDVRGAVKRFLKYGGSFQSTLANAEKQPCVYMKDPEGNIVEFHVPFPGVATSAGKTIASILGLLPDRSIRSENPEKKSSLKFIHVNFITENWQKLCDYYKSVLGAADYGKLKDHQGKYKSGVIGVPEVNVVGRHILLPGLEKDYPTFEIFTYSVKGRQTVAESDSLGINLIGFTTESLKSSADDFVSAGGKLVSEKEDCASVLDPDGNRIIIRK